MNDYLNVIRTHYADFQGRTRRREYWVFTAVNTAVLLVLQLVLLVAVHLQASAEGQASPLFFLVLGLIVIYALAVLIPSIAVTVRRLHDTGKSGWWYLITFVPFVGSIILLIFTVMDSEPGTNRWGPNPKGMQNAGAPSW